MRDALRLGVVGGLWAASLVGLGEALFVLSGSSTTEYFALAFAVLIYGVAGMLWGLVLGLGLALAGRLRPTSEAGVATVAWILTALPWGTSIAVNALDKRLFEEQGLPSEWWIGLLLGVVGLAAFSAWLGPIFLRRTPLGRLLRARSSIGAYVALLGLTTMFSVTPRGAGGATDVAPSRDLPDAHPSAGPIVIVLVDTLRADALAHAPAVQRFMTQSVTFEQHISMSAWTRPAVASLLTGQRPSVHGCELKTDVLADDVHTLPELLAQSGYVTGALVNNPNLTRSFNLQQGFDYFLYEKPDAIAGASESTVQLSLYQVLRRLQERPGRVRRPEHYYQPATVVLDHARTFVEANEGRPYFLLAHLMEPHDPYFSADLSESVGRAWRREPAAEEASAMRALYAAEVGRMDVAVGAFLDWLEARGWDDTTIVLTSDHGEEFAEHGGFWHGRTLYDEQLHTPLIVKLPHQAFAGSRVAWAVRQIDIAPSLALLAGAAVPETWEGQDLFDRPSLAAMEDVIEGGVAVGMDRPAISELNFEGVLARSIRAEGWKYIRAVENNPRGIPPEALYDLNSDASEQVNLAGRETARQASLSRLLRTGPDRGAEVVVLGCAECRRLEALGYEEDCGAVCDRGKLRDPGPVPTTGTVNR